MLITIDRPSDRAVKQSIKKARERIGRFSEPSKLPCFAWSIPAQLCKTGSKLAKIAGSVCSDCYALKNNYHFPNVKNALARRFSTLTNLDQWELDFIEALQGESWFRWFDSGDIQSLAMLRAINNIAKATPHCRHWLPTKEYGIVRRYLDSGERFADNLTVRLSAHKIDQTIAPMNTGTNSLVFSPDHFAKTQDGAAMAVCKAPAQGGQCLDCRACWSKEVQTVVYKQH